ncbi:MAG TPA: DUF1015 family protein [Geobacteraceae bacterium]|nr:DUF1015 family protein [Geobacteraceae bacterium]
MARIKPFRALRPPRELAEKVAALPYDVMDTEEARAMAAGNPSSFLHISRPEIDLPPNMDPHSEEVYEKGRENLRKLVDQGLLCQDGTDCYYVYRQKMGALTQTGLVVCAGVDDYLDGVIKKHELTRADKEEDRVRHIDRLDANDEPVFLTCRNRPAIGALIEELTTGPAEYDFRTDDGVTHSLWLVADTGKIDVLTGMFAELPALYVADGHHRSAAASRVRELRQRGNPAHTGNEEYNFFLAVIFPDSEMNIMPYNRVVKDLNLLSVAEFMARVATRFEISPASSVLEPGHRHQFGMYLGGKWYELLPKEGSFSESDAVARLDVSILQDNLLSPILGIRNPRTDQRIHFVGGIRGTGELERLVDGGEYAVAFALFPTSIHELIELADAGKIMPPKSTWFEPKLRSGLFVHLLS